MSFQRVGKKVTIYAIGYQRDWSYLLAKFRSICLEVEAVCKYTASTSLYKTPSYFRKHGCYRFFTSVAYRTLILSYTAVHVDLLLNILL